MKSKIIKTVMLLFILYIPFTNVFWNFISLNEGSGYIPDKSSIFTFSVLVFDEGSGGYWRYGEDDKYYYYFSLTEEKTYFYIDRNNQCLNFNKIDINTWCNAIKVKQQ